MTDQTGAPSRERPPWRRGVFLPALLLAVIWPTIVLARPPVLAVSGLQDCSNGAAIAIHDGYAYAGTGSRLTIFDISDPAAPVAVGRSEELPGPIQDVVVTGPFVVLALGDAGLSIVDTTDPGQPRVASLAAAPVDRVVVADSRVYTIGDPDRLMVGNPSVFQVIDLADPDDPFQVRRLENLEGEVADLVVAGGYAYAVGYRPTLSVLEVTDPLSPRRKGTRDLSRVPGFAAALTEPGYLYVSGAGRPLMIFDVSDPAQPRLLFPQDTLTALRFLQGTRGLRGGLVPLPEAHLAYLGQGVGDFPHVLRIFDVADPSQPTEVGTYRLASPPGPRGNPGRWRIAAAEHYLYVASWEGLQVLDLSDPTVPTPIWSASCL